MDSKKRLVENPTTGYSYIDEDKAIMNEMRLESEKKDKSVPKGIAEYCENDALATVEAFHRLFFGNPKMTGAAAIKDVIFNPPATIVFWSDGEKTIVKARGDETFDPEKGLAMAIVKRVFSGRGGYYSSFIKKYAEKFYMRQELRKAEGLNYPVTYFVAEEDCYCTITSFYENVAKYMGFSNTENLIFDCTKICTNKAVAGKLETYYTDEIKISGGAFATLMLVSGPKANLEDCTLKMPFHSEPIYLVKVEKGFVTEKK